MPDLAWIDGEVLPLDQARIPVVDLGFGRGLGVFETVRTYDGYPYAVAAHLERLWAGAAALGIPPQFDAATLRPILRDLWQRSGHADVRLNIIVTPGDHVGGVFGGLKPRCVVLARELVTPPAEAYADGVSAITFEAQRLLPNIKTTSYLAGLTGMKLAREAGAHEALYVDADGRVSEGVTSNVLLRRGGAIVTPVDDVLPGITRGTLRDVVRELGRWEWQETTLFRQDLYEADEIWICSSVRELMAVVRLDGRAIGSGRPGDAYRVLSPQLNATIRARAASEA